MEFWYNLPTEWWAALISPSQWVFAWIVAGIVVTICAFRSFSKKDSDPSDIIPSAGLGILVPPFLWASVYVILGFVSMMIWLVTH